MKWERKPDWTPEKNPYPRMLYMARQRPDGRYSVGEVEDRLCGGYAGAAVQFSASCQVTVKNETEEQKYMEMGYRRKQEEALERFEAKQESISDLAAERAYLEARMSNLAQAEAAEADKAAGLKHLAEVPEKPLVKRGRKPAEATN
jgi:hypothetical protein